MHRICNKTFVSEMIDCTEAVERNLLDQPSLHHHEAIMLPAPTYLSTFPFSCLAVLLTGMFVLITSGCCIPERAGTERNSKQKEGSLKLSSPPPMQLISAASL